MEGAGSFTLRNGTHRSWRPFSPQVLCYMGLVAAYMLLLNDHQVDTSRYEVVTCLSDAENPQIKMDFSSNAYAALDTLISKLFGTRSIPTHSHASLLGSTDAASS